MKLLDARAILGLPLQATTDEIEQHWATCGEQHGFPLRLTEAEIQTILEEGPEVGQLVQVISRVDEEGRLWTHSRLHPDVPTGLRTMRRQITAYVSEGRWVADCLECNSGIALPRDMTKAACLGCGRVYPIKWPDALDEIEDDLAPLPLPEQNWSSVPPVVEPQPLYSDGWAVPAEPDAVPAEPVEVAA